MNTHELAKALLAGPDINVSVGVYQRPADGSDKGGDVEYFATNDIDMKIINNTMIVTAILPVS
ncbi:Uncharacterised protein [Yersinia pseudotuberculosis]|uniref:Uncharacterized protein n=1 Tax=Yersinia similis TaxID=367190 RepID=A0A0T9QKJ0_9GAMM|nr:MULTISPECIES: hypothetical protein [Yersinia pseudotuberculosis complex]BET62245.1 hypothetical protein YPSE1_17040 [Yersinia pseudotuberculosis]CNI16269.1 Uncharacterised protein [Yersinia similis]CNK58829.1 Uncharacterised protein [Yersinia pseudotuberculosis]